MPQKQHKTITEEKAQKIDERIKKEGSSTHVNIGEMIQKISSIKKKKKKL